MADTFARGGSAVLQAGAGAGKTHGLVTVCLHALGGVGRPPLAAARLWAVTFTEKAAAELKARLRQRVDRLANGDCVEAELQASCAELGVPLPPVELWRRVRRDLGLAQVSTLHGLCAQILRRHAGAAGVDPGFSVLDEREAGELLREATEQTVLRALEGALGAEVEEASRRICTELGFRGGRFSTGLADGLGAVLRVLGESGEEPLALVERSPGLRSDAAADALARARQELRAAVEALAAADSARRASENVERLRAALGERELKAMFPPLQSALSGLRAAGPLKEPITAVKEAVERLAQAEAGVRVCRLARDFAALAGRAAARYRELKARASALDFDDLTRLSRELFARDAQARELERSRVGALLVDEFQDTSRAQIELLSHLAPPDGLVIVGDRKQSIYEFRGADVAGAQRFADAALRGGAARHVLSQSRRSRPALVHFANLLFEKTLRFAEHPFDTPFTPDDALTAFRPPGPPGACAELIDVDAQGVDAEAEAVANRIAALLAPDAPAIVFDGEAPRRARGGDIAILLRRFTNLEAFRRALLRRRIPHLVWKGRGFHQSPAVVDLLSFLSAAADPDDALAHAAVLRSPFGPVSDDGLVLLGRGRRLGRGSLRDLSGLAGDDAAAAARIARVLDGAGRELDRLGPASLLEAVLAETDFVAACAGGLHGEQAAANIGKLLDAARAAELRGDGTRTFLRRMRALADDEHAEAEAPVVEERDPHAVRILTVHAAKGLEFPVVVVPECAAPSYRAGGERTLIAPDAGFALKVDGLHGERTFGLLSQPVCDERSRRELSQQRRLFYVAVTRARDYVVLAGRKAKKQECWRLFIDAVLDDAQAAGLLTVIPNGGPKAAVLQTGPAPVDADASLEAARPPADADPAVARVAAQARPSAASVSAPVTQLADAAVCPRRYQLLHELRLEEHPEQDAPLPEPLDDAGRPATALGTLAHRLLELAPLHLPPAEVRAALERELRAEGEDPERHGEVLAAAVSFLESPLGRRVAAAREGRIQRELPFTLRLPGAPEVLVRGQIDALLLEDEAATVIDYKLSQARDPERYAAQLDAYALAAHQLTGGELGVRTGIVFLRSPGAPFAARPVATPERLQETRVRLGAAGRAIAEGRSTGVFAKVAPDTCRAIGCGFLRRCHG